MTSRQTLSPVQLYALARKAGLSADRAVTAAAVAMAESGGRSWVTSANPDGGTNVGPWQLDTPGGGGAGYTVAQLQDPWTNAQAMAKASKDGTDWSTWQTYAENTYAEFLPDAAAAQIQEGHAVQDHGGGGSWIDQVLHDIRSGWNDTGGKAVSAAGNALAWPGQITGFFSSADDFVSAAMWLFNPANWVRIIAGFFGLLLAGAGLFMLAKAA